MLTLKKRSRYGHLLRNTYFHNTFIHFIPRQLLSERIVQIEVQRLVLLHSRLHKLLPQRGATHYPPSARLQRMRHIDREAMRKHAKGVPAIAQVLQPLHLVVPVVQEALVEGRQARRLLHHHVRLLCAALEAHHVGQVLRVRLHHPPRRVVVVKPVPRAEAITLAVTNAMQELVLLPGEHAIDDPRAVSEGITLAGVDLECRYDDG